MLLARKKLDDFINNALLWNSKKQYMSVLHQNQYVDTK